MYTFEYQKLLNSNESFKSFKLSWLGIFLRQKILQLTSIINRKIEKIDSRKGRGLRWMEVVI